MLRKAFSQMVTTILLLAIVSILPFSSHRIGATSRTIIVPTHYPTISEALNFATDGDTIYVLNGTYKEDIYVDKSVRVIGESKYATIINGCAMLVSSDIELKHFNITNVFPPSSGGYAVLLHRSNNVLIEDNIIYCNSGAGIYFQTDPGPAPQNITIQGNDVLWYNVSWDVWVNGGIYVGTLINDDYSRTSKGLKLVSNKIEGWPDWAIAGFLSGKNEFINNTMLNNRLGMGFGFGDSDSVFRGNIINATGRCFGLWSSSVKGFLQDIDASNMINGKPMYYLANQSDVTIEPGTLVDIGFLGIVNSEHVYVQDLNISACFLLAYVKNGALKCLRVSRNTQLFECRNYKILGCTFNGGLQVENSENISVERNDIINCSFSLHDSEDCTIKGNSIKGSYGFYGSYSSVVYITGNSIANNTVGVQLSDCSNFTISGNDISKNEKGIYLFDSNGNCIYLNNFIDNEQQLELSHSFTNSYDNGYEGNFWTDYNGTDISRDGIGDTDTPHLYVDWLPLIGMIRFFNMTYDEDVYEICTISNSTIISCDLKELLNKLSFNVTGPYNTIGFCRTRLPKQIGLEVSGNNYTILINENEPSFIKNWTDIEYTYLYFEYGHPQDEVAPITTDNYDGTWHVSNFMITLTAIDYESGVAETYYTINDGTVKAISIDGQPYITTENANNTLEYWSVDNAGNEELPHNILIGIKLDKTSPTIGIPLRLPEVGVQPDQQVKVSVNVTDFMSDVKNVTLSYNLNDSAIWIDLPMTLNSTTGLHEAIISGQQANTLVKYRIETYDNAGNYKVEDNSGEYYVYTVVPEFPSTAILLLALLFTTFAVIIGKKRLLENLKTNPKPKPYRVRTHRVLMSK